MILSQSPHKLRQAGFIRKQLSFSHRQGNVSSHPIRPTWVPFRATVSSEEKLAFSLRLMEGESEGWRSW